MEQGDGCTLEMSGWPLFLLEGGGGKETKVCCCLFKAIQTFAKAPAARRMQKAVRPRRGKRLLSSTFTSLVPLPPLRQASGSIKKKSERSQCQEIY